MDVSSIAVSMYICKMVNAMLHRVFLVVISCVFAVAISEVMLRCFYPIEPKYQVWEPNLHHTFLPDSTIFYGISGPAEFTINKDGLRGEVFNKRKINYITLGGSTTECLYLDDTETWQHHLSTQTGYGIASMGKSGCTLYENYLHLKYAISQFSKLKGIVVMAGLNDMYKRLAHGTLHDQQFPLSTSVEDSVVKQIFWSDVIHEEVWWRRSAIFRLVRKVYHQNKQVPWTSVQDDTGENYRGWRAKRQNALLSDSLPDFGSALKEFSILLDSCYQQCKQQNLQLILVTQATLYKDSMPDFETRLLWMGGKGNFMNEQVDAYYSPKALLKAAEAYNDVLRNFSMRYEEVKLIDLAAQLPKDTSVFYDDCHFNESGARKVSAILSNGLKH